MLIFALASILLLVLVLVAMYSSLDSTRKDRDFYKSQEEKAWGIIGRERSTHDQRVAILMQSKNEIITKLRAESNHNFSEGLAAQNELGKLREQVERAKAILSPKLLDVVGVSS